jgi:hypothetical protein
MGKQTRKQSVANRLRGLLDDIGRLLNPPKVVPARVPVRNGPELPARR